MHSLEPGPNGDPRAEILRLEKIAQKYIAHSKHNEAMEVERDIEHLRAELEARPQAVAAPIVCMGLDDGAIPLAYHIHIHEQVCTCCGAISERREAFAFLTLEARWHRGKPVAQLRAVDHFEYKLPLQRRLLGTTTTPTCDYCDQRSDVDPFRNLPDGEALRAARLAAWQETQRRKALEANEATRAKAEAKRKPKLSEEDLLALL